MWELIGLLETHLIKLYICYVFANLKNTAQLVDSVTFYTSLPTYYTHLFIFKSSIIIIPLKAIQKLSNVVCLHPWKHLELIRRSN